MDVKRGYKQLVTLTKRVKYVMTYIKEYTNINEHRRVIVKLNNKNISKSAYRDMRIVLDHHVFDITFMQNELPNHIIPSQTSPQLRRHCAICHFQKLLFFSLATTGDLSKKSNKFQLFLAIA